MTARRKRIRQTSLAALAFLLFQKSLTPGEAANKHAQTDEEDAPPRRVRCPLCHWQPRSSDLWYCGDCGHPEYFFAGCGMMWNTFTTRGLCPGCLHQWRYTSCLRCAAWSPHEEWYGDEGA